MQKIYNDRSVWIGSYVGGPLVAGYIIAENFKVLGEHDKVWKTWIYTILITIIIFTSIYLIPGIEKIPSAIIPITYTALAASVVQYYQKNQIQSFLGSGGEVYKWWRSLIVGLIGLVVTLIPIFGYAYFSDPILNSTTKTYGSLKHEIYFNKDEIQESTIDKIADGFTQESFFDEVSQKFVYIKQIDNTIEIYISVIEGTDKNKEEIEAFTVFHSGMQKFLPNNKIVFNLTGNDIDHVIKRIE